MPRAGSIVAGIIFPSSRSVTPPCELLHNLAMTKAERTLAILSVVVLLIAGQAMAQKPDEVDFDGFEDNLLALTQVSEQITIDYLSLKSFRCKERIVAIETAVNSKSMRQHEAFNSYTVERKPDKRVNEKLVFSELRTPAQENTATTESHDFPLFEAPFTGKWIDTFSFENRLANDFKKLPGEQIGGGSCLVFAFETVPEISVTKVPLLGAYVPLRQRGRVWIDAKTHQLVRLVAKQLKLPKGCKSYEYRIDFQPQTLFGRSLALPFRTELKIDMKDRGFAVVQEYSNFEVM
jgi:hypothetical protein